MDIGFGNLDGLNQSDGHSSVCSVMSLMPNSLYFPNPSVCVWYKQDIGFYQVESISTWCMVEIHGRNNDKEKW